DDLIHVDPVRPTGLFLRETPDSGERQVTYYRAGSAASALDEDRAQLLTPPRAPRALVVSGLTASLGEGPRRLMRRLVMQAAAAGTSVVLDANLRPALGTEEAVRTMAPLLPYVDLLVLGDDESGPLLGVTEPADVLSAARDAGATETVLKGGERGCWLWDDGVRHIPAHPTRAVDTVGAGDAFLGAYLAARLCAAPATDAARLGARIAAGVVARTGDTDGLPDPSTATALLRRTLRETARSTATDGRWN
ncbi:sugar kinase, partial [Streptomyces pakalii]